MIPLAFLQNFSGPEILVVLVVIIVLFGAKKIPDIARSLGRSMGEFKKGQKEGEDLARQATEAKTTEQTLTDDTAPGDK